MFKGFQKLLVLKELSKSDLSGYALIKRLEGVIGKKPSTGYIYPLLNELYEKKYLSKKEEGQKIIYRLDTEGRRMLKELDQKKEQLDKILFSLESNANIKKDHLNKFRKEIERNHDLMMLDMDIISKLQKVTFKIYRQKSPSKRGKMREIISRTVKDIEELARK